MRRGDLRVHRSALIPTKQLQQLPDSNITKQFLISIFLIDNTKSDLENLLPVPLVTQGLYIWLSEFQIIA